MKALPTWIGRRRRGLFGDLVSFGPASLVVRAAGGVCVLITNVVLGRMLGPSGAGVYYLGVAIVSAAAMAARLGLDQTVMRLSAVAAEQRDDTEVAALTRITARFIFTTSAVAAATLFAGAPLLARLVFRQPALSSVLRLIAIGTIGLALTAAYVGLLRGTRRPLSATALETLAPAAGTLLLLLLLGSRMGARGAALAFAIASVAAAAAGWFILTKSLRGVRRAHASLRGLLATSVPLFWVSTMNLVMQYADVLILGALAAEREVGVYAVALRAAVATSVITASVTGVVAPQFAQLFARGERRKLQQLACGSTLAMSAASAPFLLVMVFAPDLVMAIFGAEFRGGSTALVWIAGGQLIQTLLGPVGFLLTMTGHERELKRVMFAAAAGFVVANWALIPPFGAAGAGAAYAVSLVAMNLGKSFFVHRRLGILVLPVLRRA